MLYAIKGVMTHFFGIVKFHVKSSQPSHQCADEEGTSRKKKKKTRHNIPLTELCSDHVSYPTPINQSQPLHALANEAHAFEKVFVRRLDVLRNQTNEQSLIHHNVVNEEVDDHLVDVGGGNGDGDRGFVDKGHGDNTGGLFGIPFEVREKTSPRDDSCLGYCKRFSDLLFADSEFLNDGVPDQSAVKQSLRLLCQSTQQQANVVLYFEALSEEYANLAYAYESCKEMKSAIESARRSRDLNKRVEELKGDKKGLEEVNVEQTDRIKHLEEELKKFEDTHQLRFDREKHIVECGNREMVRGRIINEYLLTFVCRLHRSAEYKRSLGEVSSLAVGNGFINGVSTCRKDEDV
uniref:Uncharacterized protein n=1 Tax=Tanacetum cinerariifolium TaxID=118510 RepID=A0A699GXY3_TANCI|nr:hypothetical protein [Tanacetum cinerariifolium]